MQTTRQRITYILSDFLAAFAAWCVFNVIRFYTLPVNSQLDNLGEYFSMPTIIVGQLAFPFLMVCLYAISGYYNEVFRKSRLEDILNAFTMSLIGAVIIFFIALFDDDIPDRLTNLEMIGIVWLLIGCSTSIERVLITRNVSKRIWNREIVFNAVVLGQPDKVAALASNLDTKHRSMGFCVSAFATPGAERPAGMPQPTFDIEDIERAISGFEGTSSFIIIPDGLPIERTLGIINGLLPTGKPVYLTPGDHHFFTTRARTSAVAGEVLTDVSKSGIPDSTRNLKFLGDIFVSAIALTVLSPFFALIAAMIKYDSKGPVFYTQTRIGYKHKPFKIIKFRSMKMDAETDGPALSTENDPRITRLGRILRKYRIDELPQFINVLKGEMSLVGPRPEREYYLKQILARAPQYNLVHQVRPGITSWGMVKFGYAQNIDQMLERMKYDLVYVENISLAVDIKILFYTVSTVLTGKGI